MIEQLEDRHEGSIEGSADAYHALMGTIEMPFEQGLTMEMEQVNPVLYWLDSTADVDDLCNEILDQNGISTKETEMMALIHYAG